LVFWWCFALVLTSLRWGGCRTWVFVVFVARWLPLVFVGVPRLVLILLVWRALLVWVGLGMVSVAWGVWVLEGKMWVGVAVACVACLPIVRWGGGWVERAHALAQASRSIMMNTVPPVGRGSVTFTC
jgi:hypothetical protein